MMLGPTLATLCFSGVLCVSAYAQQPVPVDDVASFLNDLRAPVDQRATGFASGEESLSKGNYVQAEEIFKKLMAQDRGTGAIEGLARVYVAENRPDEALSFLEKQVAQKPSRPDILFAFVRLAVELHAFDPAITALRKARDLRPMDESIALELARVLSASGQESEATDIYRQILGVDPGDGVALLRLAAELSGPNGNLDVARAAAELAKKQLPNSADASDTLGWIYVKSGRPRMAVPLFRELVDRAPTVWTYHFHLAFALSGVSGLQSAIGELRSALECNPPADKRNRIQTLLIELAGLPK